MLVFFSYRSHYTHVGKKLQIYDNFSSFDIALATKWQPIKDLYAFLTGKVINTTILRNYCINSHTVFSKMFRIVLKSYTYRSKQEGFKVVMTLESRILPSLTTTFFIFARSVLTLFNVRAL